MLIYLEVALAAISQPPALVAIFVISFVYAVVLIGICGRKINASTITALIFHPCILVFSIIMEILICLY